jgi:hypothetical protein
MNATTTTRPIYEIASDIIDDIRAQYAGKPDPAWLGYAMPYLQPMLQLDKITDQYYYDDAESVVLYALSNLQQWRGETARRIKAELKGMTRY